MPIKPLTFDDEVKSNKPEAVQPKKLDFTNVPPVQPSGKNDVVAAMRARQMVQKLPSPPTPPLFLETGGQWVNGQLVNTRSAQSDVVPKPLPKKVVDSLALALNVPTSPAVLQAIENFKKQYPEIYRTQGSRVDVQLRSLLPLKLDVVVDWGTKTLERMRSSSKEGMALITQFAQSNGNDMMQKVTEAMKPVTGMFARFRQQDPLAYEAPLTALCASLSLWIPSCVRAISAARKNHSDMLLKMSTLSLAVETAGDPSDAMLAQTLHNRRVTLQSGVIQAELMVKQLEDIHHQMVDQKMRVDQVINVTLSAYQAVKTRTHP